MGNQLGTLIDAHSPPGIHGLFLGIVVTTAALCVFTLHIPTAVGIGNDMMFFSWHGLPPVCFGTAHGTAVCIRIVNFSIPYGIRLTGVPAEVNRLSDFQRIGMLVSMNLMVQTGVQCLIFINTIIGHLNPFS